MGSDSFSFFTLHSKNFYTQFPKGGLFALRAMGFCSYIPLLPCEIELILYVINCKPLFHMVGGGNPDDHAVRDVRKGEEGF